MPHLIYTPTAIADWVRLRDFLKTKNLDAAKRAVSAIKSDIEKAAFNLERFRPGHDLPHYREIIIDFGSSGYMVAMSKVGMWSSCVSNISLKMTTRRV